MPGFVGISDSFFSFFLLQDHGSGLVMIIKHSFNREIYYYNFLNHKISVALARKKNYSKISVHFQLYTLILLRNVFGIYSILKRNSYLF